jgi:uncharacterized membrane protein YcgQ (UPF0703/DUF1980 family)
MTCCFADAYGEPVKIMVKSPEALDFSRLRGSWVRVLGKLDFKKLGNDYMSVITAQKIERIPAPANRFDN